MSNIIQFKRLSLKNFLSFGPEPTTINLMGNHITVVLGLNHDTGGDESRNGVGKSSIVDAISYAIFGKTTRGISNQKLVNKMARRGQGMLVVLEFDAPTGSYRIERGESPSKLKLYRKDLDNVDDFLKRDGKTFIYDISRNKNETTDEIEKIIGFDLKLFEFLVANTTDSIPFMKLPEDKKREIAEHLMGLNLLTDRATELKLDRKDRRKELISAESATEATRQANKRIERQLDELLNKADQWEAKRDKDTEKLKKQIAELSGIDITEQIETLKMIDIVSAEDKRISAEQRQATLELRQAKRDLSDLQRSIDEAQKKLERLEVEKEKLDDSVCPTCSQHWIPDPSVIEEVESGISEIRSLDVSEKVSVAETTIQTVESIIEELKNEELELDEEMTAISSVVLRFDSVEEASSVGATIESAKEQLSVLEKTENPHMETISGLQKNAMVEIDDSVIRELSNDIDHYNYLIDLLQSKDSFLRKAIIGRWLPLLNFRIAHYLEILELPYVVQIKNDLSMSITDFNEEFDWGNLSKGQRQRVTIALNLSFQDIFEATNTKLSLLLWDELIDNGICNRGAQQSLYALRETCDSKGKRVFLITHRLDVADQVEDNMVIEMKNKISRIEAPSFEE